MAMPLAGLRASLPRVRGPVIRVPAPPCLKLEIHDRNRTEST
ncbi:hypothetical protein GDI0227 [Gluconacetobacter diazotrophicus PA1 5]|uniref:Uncharacterized protein n=1 Tax=Gluconacetobacter diazotrophicus (strain ATCC 49037 / DSM 5601 / CCUG 37298 / CIP 103539 / LMG 7603 / PAl5) TaxID=272568 RepID=A9H2M0_GLUDA|nr:hypothetical protein GDI0227 [Gluconacetobacter diazotrophicus PA1 5]